MITEPRFELANFAGIDMLFRPETRDHYILRRVMDENIYGVTKDYLSGKAVIDVGAHIGGFSLLAWAAGAEVWAFEPERGNFALLALNSTHRPRIHLSNSAVGWGEPQQALCIHPENTGCHSLREDINGFTAVSQRIQVDVLRPAQIFSLPGRPIALLKLDCEGGEEDILPWLFDSQWPVEAISVEFHRREFMAGMIPRLKAAYPKYRKISEFEWTFRK